MTISFLLNIEPYSQMEQRKDVLEFIQRHCVPNHALASDISKGNTKSMGSKTAEVIENIPKAVCCTQHNEKIIPVFKNPNTDFPFDKYLIAKLEQYFQSTLNLTHFYLKATNECTEFSGLLKKCSISLMSKRQASIFRRISKNGSVELALDSRRKVDVRLRGPVKTLEIIANIYFGSLSCKMSQKSEDNSYLKTRAHFISNYQYLPNTLFCWKKVYKYSELRKDTYELILETATSLTFPKEYLTANSKNRSPSRFTLEFYPKKMSSDSPSNPAFAFSSDNKFQILKHFNPRSDSFFETED